MTSICIERTSSRKAAATRAILLASLALIGACSKPAPATTNLSAAPSAASAAAQTPPAAAEPTAAAPTGNAVSGIFTGDGKQAALTEVTALPDDPFDGQPVTALVFTAKDQAGDPKAATNALFGNFGDAIVVKFTPDGSVIEADVVNSGLKEPGSVSISGVLTIKNLVRTGGQISGELTSGGPTDVFGQKLNVDLTFHAKAP